MYRNVMELLVEDKVAEMWKSKSGCQCDQCREDVVALTLNHMPPQYVVSREGELYTKMKHVDVRSEFEITKQIAVAMNIITASPRHFVEEPVAAVQPPQEFAGASQEFAESPQGAEPPEYAQSQSFDEQSREEQS